MSDGNLFRAFDVSAAGLSAQRARLNVLSANIANAQTTRTPEGGPYRRRRVEFSTGGPAGGSSFLARFLDARTDLSAGMSRTSGKHLTEAPVARFEKGQEGLTWSVTTDDQTPLRWEHEPGHPDANAEGYVAYPNVDILSEMVDLLAASRAYEANVTVLNAGKGMMKKALEI